MQNILDVIGSLQREDVHLSTFGRTLNKEAGALRGFARSRVDQESETRGFARRQSLRKCGAC
jgi:hypothetical protein